MLAAGKAVGAPARAMERCVLGLRGEIAGHPSSVGTIRTLDRGGVATLGLDKEYQPLGERTILLETAPSLCVRLSPRAMSSPWA